MKIPLNIEIRVTPESVLSQQDMLHVRYWVEEAVFAKFGRSPCAAKMDLENDTACYDYAVDWDTEWST
jgi:hypothetical protein